MASYLAAPAWIDRHTEGTRGTHLRIAHLHFNAMIKHTCNMIHMLLNMISIFIRMTNFQIKQFVWIELFSFEIIGGFSELIWCSRTDYTDFFVIDG